MPHIDFAGGILLPFLVSYMLWERHITADSRVEGLISCFSRLADETLNLLHSERPKLHTILAFLSAIGLNQSSVCI